MASASASVKRLQKELQGLQENPIGYVSAAPNDENIFDWTATIIGPPETPYEGGVFTVLIKFPPDYPFKPPKILFSTPVFHPNINRKGEICLSTLRDKWSPALTISKVLLSICSLLNEPNPDDPLVQEADTLYKFDREEYNKIAQSWTREHAT